MNKFIVIIIYLLSSTIPIVLSGQLVPMDYDPYGLHTIDRIETLYPTNTNFHSAIRYQNISNFLNQEYPCLTQNDVRDIDHLSRTFSQARTQIIDSLKLSFFNSIYSDPYHFLSINKENFRLTINPVFQFSLGNEHNEEQTIFQNTRGVKLRGDIDQKVYFYTSIYENQRRFLSHIEGRIDRFGAIPGQGFFKKYQSGVLNDIQGWDYLNAQAFVGFNLSRSINLQFGHGNNFIGNGIRSMVLSDYGHNYLYLKFNTSVWKFHYQNIFAELSPIGSRDNDGNTLLPKKYMSAHYLSFNFSPRLNIGLYEAVIFSRPNYFEFQYLNPIILYRTVEQFLDSPDNVLIALNAKWAPIDKVQIYGQMMVDELRTDQLLTGNGWWGNKIGYQVGAKYFNAFNVDHLDFQIEYNSARPYTYTHRTDPNSTIVSGSYSHYNQPLAHPLGANFNELIINLHYQINTKWFFELKYLSASYGDDLIQNIGSDILQSYESRLNDFGNFTGQGAKTTVSLLSFRGSWQFRPNYFVDLDIINRRQNSEEAQLNYRSEYLGISLRANMFNQNLDY